MRDRQQQRNKHFRDESISKMVSPVIDGRWRRATCVNEMKSRLCGLRLVILQYPASEQTVEFWVAWTVSLSGSANANWRSLTLLVAPSRLTRLTALPPVVYSVGAVTHGGGYLPGWALFVGGCKNSKKFETCPNWLATATVLLITGRVLKHPLQARLKPAEARSTGLSRLRRFRAR